MYREKLLTTREDALSLETLAITNTIWSSAPGFDQLEGTIRNGSYFDKDNISSDYSMNIDYGSDGNVDLTGVRSTFTIEAKVTHVLFTTIGQQESYGISLT